MEALKTILIFVAAFSIVLLWLSSIPSDTPPRRKLEPLHQALPPRTLRVLDSAEHLVLLSLEPSPSGWCDSQSAAREKFHKWPVLGKAEIRRVAERAELLRAIYQSRVVWNAVTPCAFRPRHGIRARIGRDTVDLVICFECDTIHIYHDERFVSWFIENAPEAVFHRALERFQLPLAP